MQHNRLQSISTIHKPHHRYIMYMYSTKETKHLRKQQPIQPIHPFLALYCTARCADSKKVSYVRVGPRKVGLKRAKLPLASAK